MTNFYAWAYAEELTPKDRMQRFVCPPVVEPVPRALSGDQLGRLFDHLVTVTDDRLEIMCWLAYGCGLRSGEIARLRCEHFHLRDDPPWLLADGKGDKRRPVPLAPAVADILGRWLASRPRTGPLLPYQRDGWEHRNIGPKQVSVLLSRTMRAAGINDSGHALRHSFATNLLAAGDGKNIRAVSRLLGHASIATTERTYTNSYDLDTKSAVLLLPDPRRRARV